MSGKESKFMVVSKGDFTPARLGEFLNTFYRTDGEEAHFLVGNVPYDGFFIPHGVITKIKKTFPEWKKSFEFFSCEGGGEVRPYSIPEHKKSAEEKRVTTKLKEITAKKGKTPFPKG